MIDNYDSFTYNLYHYLILNHAAVDILRNDAPELLNNLDKYQALVISPGPSKPVNAGYSRRAAKTFLEKNLY